MEIFANLAVVILVGGALFGINNKVNDLKRDFDDYKKALGITGIKYSKYPPQPQATDIDCQDHSTSENGERPSLRFEASP